MATTSWLKAKPQLRIAAILEGISYLAIFGISMPLKYFFDMPEANKVVGMAHGVLFIWYVVLVFVVGQQEDWSWKKMVLAWLASLIPFGTFYVERKWLKD